MSGARLTATAKSRVQIFADQSPRITTDVCQVTLGVQKLAPLARPEFFLARSLKTNTQMVAKWVIP